MQRSLIDNRTIRVFISSTFQDMQDERTELMKKTLTAQLSLLGKKDSLRGDRICDDIAISFNNVGRTCKKLGQIDRANDYFRRAAKRWRKLGNNVEAQNSLSEIIDDN